MQVTQNGETTTVTLGKQKFKLTFNNRYRRFDIRLDGRKVGEDSFQGCLNRIAAGFYSK